MQIQICVSSNITLLRSLQLLTATDHKLACKAMKFQRRGEIKTTKSKYTLKIANPDLYLV